MLDALPNHNGTQAPPLRRNPKYQKHFRQHEELRAKLNTLLDHAMDHVIGNLILNAEGLLAWQQEQMIFGRFEE